MTLNLHPGFADVETLLKLNVRHGIIANLEFQMQSDTYRGENIGIKQVH